MEAMRGLEVVLAIVFRADPENGMIRSILCQNKCLLGIPSH